MALTVTLTQAAGNLAGVFSPAVDKYALVTGDASYPAGGYAVSTGTFGFAQVLLGAIPLAFVAGGYYPVYDPIGKTLRVYTFPASTTGALSEVATGTNLSALSLNIKMVGY
jgi:hypothetical protein